MTDVTELTFEAAYAELESIIARLDTDDLPLEESVTLFERGRRLTLHCQTLLDSAELRVSQLLDDGTTAPL
jgi:exodeoxyribonuclease VII small subunit